MQNVAAVRCNFTFIESDEHMNPAAPAKNVDSKTVSNRIFACEQNTFDESFDIVHANDSDKGGEVVNRFSQDYFELQEVSCISSKRFITPRALNNIYNQLTAVLNTAVFVQRIQIVECR